MLSSVAFVGAGPTTIYTLHALIHRARRGFALSIFEEQAHAGRGTPYCPGWNDPAMLANIASMEIPALEETLIEWLARQPAARLARLGIDPGEVDERAFYPRLALGEFFQEQLSAILDRAKAKGIEVTVRTRCKVLDILSTPHGMTITARTGNAPPFEQHFDHVVLATGHQWPAEPEVRPGYFLSPWPASALAQTPPVSVGIRGSSLTAIDAAVALAVAHGEFVEDDDDLSYVPAPDSADFHITMMSRKGLLPEADFYFPLPYEPLRFCTVEAMEQLCAHDGPLLDAAFGLFKRELTDADPDYAERIGLPRLDLESFSEAYFADRMKSDPFLWAKDNLREAQRNYAARFTVPWRYAILRMHEVIETIVPHLDDDEFARFSRFLAPVFVDDYATVPHETILRLLALNKEGRLSIIAVGEDYRIDSHRPESGATLIHKGASTHFPLFIEAMGQRALSAGDFPFPSLRRQGIIQDEGESDGPARGIAMDDQFHPVSRDIPVDRLFCLSLPFIMGRHPFVQGITSGHAMGIVVGEQLADALATDTHRKPAGTQSGVRRRL